MLNLLDSLSKFNPESDYALAIIQSTEGSTYRKAGAMMLIDSQLNYWGLISGGCLEGDILENSRQLFAEKKDMSLRYDMRGDQDLLWGLGLGCDGAVNLLIKYLPASKSHFGFFDHLKKLDLGSAFLLTIELDNNGQLFFEPVSKESLPANNPQAEFHESQQRLTLPLLAPTNILICGASPDVPPVTAIAKQLGWKTTVIDHRRDFASESKFPEANRVAHVKRSQWEDFELDLFDAAVVMSHQFERDEDYLKRLLDSPIPYIGLLGPSKRRDKLLEACDRNFVQLEGRVFGPVGLDIGADTPETIALAIISEIQAVKAKKSTGFCYQDESR